MIVPALALILIFATGCPVVPESEAQYDAGFLQGFADDDEYWAGYFDGFDTLDIEPIFYTGHQIPELSGLTFDAGFYDGIWYAYNDGYFTDYRFAFVIGFSEGYDNGYWPDHLDFLANDVHPEFLNGGWIDGYHDGFTQGRVFGAFDFRNGIDFVWLDALLDYEAGVDVSVGPFVTGDASPAEFYEYGTNPFDLIKSERPKSAAAGHVAPSLRGAGARKIIDPNTLSSLRPLTQQARDELQIVFDTSLRSDRELLLTSTYIQRIDRYIAADVKNHTPSRGTVK